MDGQNQPGALESARSDTTESSRSVDTVAQGKPDDPMRLQSHTRAHPHDRAHVDLQQDEYTPEEAARMLGTSLEVIMHAARTGELIAEKAGHKVVCIKRADLVDWLNRRGPGV